MVSSTHEQNIICSQTLCMTKSFFVCSFCRSHSWLLASEKEEKFALNDNEVFDILKTLIFVIMKDCLFRDL